MTPTDWRHDTAAPVRRLLPGQASRSVSSSALIFFVLASFLLYVALFLLFRVKVLRPDPTQVLQGWRWLDAFSNHLMPNRTGAAVGLYGLLVVGLVTAWAGALWFLHAGAHSLRLWWILLPVLLFSLVLVFLPGMFSKDLYLYSMYGRVLSFYGENPILVAPKQFNGDPHLKWAPYMNLPSAYGPVWLMLSGILSDIGGESRSGNVLAYRLAAMLLHLGVTVSLWALLRRVRPEIATWGAAFYGWNPLVLFETVANGHNDVMLALFAVLSLLAVAYRRWLFAVGFLIAGAMAKATGLLLLPVLVLAWVRMLPDVRGRIRALVSAGVVAVGTAIFLYSPLWGGMALYENIQRNPAYKSYANSVWELLVTRLVLRQDKAAVAELQGNLDLVRNLLFATAFLYIVYRVWRGQRLADAWVWLWFAYCLSLAWIFPWYFVLAIPLAAACGPGRTAALAVGLTLGGLLYWVGRPRLSNTEVSLLVEYRSILLFAPPVLVAIWGAFGGANRWSPGRDKRAAEG